MSHYADNECLAVAAKSEGLFRWPLHSKGRMTPTNIPAGPAKMRILIVDDHPGVALGYGLVFQKRGYEPSAANNVTQALNMCRRDCPEVLRGAGVPPRGAAAKKGALRG